jgi:hypothetical protein
LERTSKQLLRTTDKALRMTNSDDNPGGGLPPGGNREVPLGGLEWLLAAGAGYGFWKLRDNEDE